MKNLCGTLFMGLMALLHATSSGQSVAPLPGSEKVTLVLKTDDFSITGDGSHSSWTKTEWMVMTKLDRGGKEYESKFKILYSPTGLYVLFQGIDAKITSEEFQDFDPIFHGDVFEIFLHPDPNVVVYYEYEVNALNKELILVISNLGGKSHNSWMPYGKSKGGVRKMVTVDGDAKTGAPIKSWKAEIFFPYGSLGLLPGIPPQSGNVWHANFCRLDYDSGEMVKWSWSPGIKKSFHELDQFLSLKFE